MTACVYVIGKFQLLHMAHVDFLHRAEDLAGAPVRVAPETVYPARVTDPTVAVSLASLLRGVV